MATILLVVLLVLLLVGAPPWNVYPPHYGYWPHSALGVVLIVILVLLLLGRV